MNYNICYMIPFKKVMSELLESEKNTIENLTNKIFSLEDQLKKANDTIHLLTSDVETKEINYKDLYQEYQELIINFNKLDKENKDLKNKLEKYEKTEKRADKLNLKVQEVQELENEYKSSIESEIKIAVDEALLRKNEEYDSLYNDLNELKNKKLKDSILTPSSSIENIKKDKINEENVLPLSGNFKCNNKQCDFISKKEINLCTKCNKLEKGKYFLKSYKIFTDPAKENIGYNTKILAASETFVKLEYLHNLYYTAQKDGIDTSNMNELIEYIKINKMLEEKQHNIIKFKIQRAHSIMLLYKDNKYKPILNYIKRINFKVKDIGKLLPEQWKQFRLFIEKDLNEQLNIFTENDNHEYINDNQEDNKKEKCIKCLNILKDNDFTYCSSCIKLCQVDDCINKKHKLNKVELEYCFQHIKDTMNFDF